MTVRFSNNAVSTLSASISAGDTTIVVQTADAAKFPSLSGGEWFPVTVTDPNTGIFEIMKCTARSGVNLTVDRAEEGTSAAAFGVGARVSHRLTAAALLALIGGSVNSDDIIEGVTQLLMTAVERAKLGHISVTQAVDLDAIETRVNALDAAVVLKGTWDASAGAFPGSGSAQAGESWIVSVGGTVGGIVFTANDRVIAIADNASTSVYAGNWHKADYTDQVVRVATLTGDISASDLRAALNVGDGANVSAAAAFGTDNRLVRSDGTGHGVQASSVSLDDAGNLYGLNSVASGNYMGISLSMLDTNATHYGTFTLGSDLTAPRSYSLIVPDGSFSYTFPAANATFAALNVEDQTATGGARVTVKDLGNLSGNTITPDPGDRSHQKITNNGAGTIAPGSNYGHYYLDVVNTTGAAIPTTSGWTKVEGSFDATTTSKFRCGCSVTADMSTMVIFKVA